MPRKRRGKSKKFKGFGGMKFYPEENDGVWDSPFSSGPCSCCDDSESRMIWVEACFCPWCANGAIYNLWNWETNGKNTTAHTGPGCLIACNPAADYALCHDMFFLPALCCGTCTATGVMRSWVRNKYKLGAIPIVGGETFIDWCFYSCSLTQITRHLISKGSVPQSGVDCITGGRQMSSKIRPFGKVSKKEENETFSGAPPPPVQQMMTDENGRQISKARAEANKIGTGDDIAPPPSNGYDFSVPLLDFSNNNNNTTSASTTTSYPSGYPMGNAEVQDQQHPKIDL